LRVSGRRRAGRHRRAPGAGRRAKVLQANAAELGGRCSWVAGDIREAGEAARIVETTRKRHGRLDALVDNAGGQYFIPAEEIALKGWRAVTRLDVQGTYAMTRAAADAGFGPDGGRSSTSRSPAPRLGPALRGRSCRSTAA
jgi:citronellol/citronellal dehydrogenase